MKKTKQLLKPAILVLLMLSVVNSTQPFALGATRLSAQSDIERLAAANEEIKYLTAKVAALEKLSKQHKGLVEALDSQVVAQEKTIAALKGVTGVDDKILASYQKSLDDAKEQIARWQGKAAFWKRMTGVGILVALAVGAGLGIALSK